MPAPLFLFSPPRSYSTVSIALLSGHPGVFGFPELGLLRSGSVAEVLAAERHPWMRQDLYLSSPLRAIAQVHEHDQGEAAIARAARWLEDRQEWPALKLLRYLTEQVAPAIGIEKSPDNVYDPDLAPALQSFPDARVIHLTRHPVTTQRSMREHYASLQLSMTAQQRSRLCARSWYLAHTKILKTLEKMPEERWRRVRAEDLVSKPEETAAPIFDWLGLPHDDDILHGLRRTEDWVFAGTGQDGRLLGGDRKFLSDPRLRPISDPGPVDFPAEWEVPEQMESKMKALAAQLGYV